MTVSKSWVCDCENRCKETVQSKVDVGSKESDEDFERRRDGESS